MNKQKQDNYKTGLTQKFGRPVLSNGFTLVELIVVITILAILGTIAIMAFSGYSKNARDSARIADIGNMKKSLELWILQSGTYPDPSSGTGITYSGSTVWLQGTFGDSVTSTVGKLEKKPVDPKYDTEYTYSVTQSKKEYQIGAVLEKDMASNVIVPQTYAATTGEAYVSGTYNGILTTVGTNPTYIIALPSIILSSIANTELKTVSSNTIVYEGKGTLPASYANLGLTMTGNDFSFTPTVVWSGATIDALNNQNEFQNLVTSLQSVYQSNEAFTTLPEYTSIVSEGDKSVGVMLFVKGLLETNTSKELTNVATIAVNFKTCNAATKPIDNGHITYTEDPTSLNQAYVQDGTECGYTCDTGWTGSDCNEVLFICGTNVSAGGETYTTLSGHDGKCWTSQNMRHIPSSGNRWCYNNVAENCTSYGAFYDFAAANTLCPQLGSGWALPTNAQWTTIVSAGATGWTGNKLSGIISTLPGFYHQMIPTYMHLGNYGRRWTSTPHPSVGGYSYYRNFNNYDSSVISDTWYNEVGLSVICIKN